MNYFKKHLTRILIGLTPLVIVLLHVAGLVPLSFIQNLENLIYDTKIRVSMPHKGDPRIVIVDIDEKSLSELGRWPWNRKTMATLSDELLQRQKVSVVGFDIVFAEPDSTSGWSEIAQLASTELKDDALMQAQLPKLKTALDFDAHFANSINRNNVALGYYFTSDRAAYTSGQLPKALIKSEDLAGREIRTTQWDGYGSNLPIFASRAAYAGFFNAIADTDGIVRTVPLLASYKGDYYESFALAVYRAAIASTHAKAHFSGTKELGGMDALQVMGADNRLLKTIRVDERGATLIQFRGLGGSGAGTFQYVSAADIVNKKIPANTFKDKIILVGSSAPGLQDLRNTPVGQAYPGVEVHANILAGMLDGKTLYKPDYALGAEFLTVLFLGLVLASVLPALSAANAAGFSLALMLIPAALNVYLFDVHGVVLPLATMLILSVLVYMLNMTYGYLVESRAKRELSQLFGSYVPPKLVAQMLENPSLHSMKAQSRELTVMFCDLRGFTQMAEKLEPLQLQTLLNTVFGKITQIVLGKNGTLDKYMGDCVMAFWGAPVFMPNHAALAVQTAVDIAQAIRDINTEHRKKSLPEIRLGIGINTGVMCVGDMGSYLRRSYTVVGDAVNIAARLESLTKERQVDLLVSENTQLQAINFNWFLVDRLQLKGRAEPLNTYSLKETQRQ